MAQNLGTLLIDVKSDTTQLVQGFNRAESAVTKTTKNMTNAVKTFAAAYVSLSAVDLARSYARQTDAITSANNKLKLVTKTTQELTTAQNELFKISQTTSQGYSESVALYSKLSDAMTKMGKSQSDVLRTVETVNKAISLSGSSAQESASAILQLGQAFGSGKLQGDELKSLSENAQALTKAIASGMGVEVGALKQLGADGKITSEVLANALAKVANSVDTEYNKMSKSIEQSFTNIENSTQKVIGEVDKLTGISQKVASSFQGISKSIDEINPESIQELINDTATLLKYAGLLGASYISVTTAIKAYSVATATATAVSATFQGGLFGLNSALVLTAVSAKALDKALKFTVLGGAVAGIALLAESFIEGSKRAEIMSKSVNELADSFETLDLKSRLADVNKELKDLDNKFKGYNDTQKMMYQGAYDIAYREKRQLEQSIELIEKKNKAQADSSKIQSLFNNVDSNKTVAVDLTTKTDKELNEIANAEKKAIDERLSQYSNYYEKIKDYSNLWKLEEQKIRQDNTKLTQVELENLISIERSNFEKRNGLIRESLTSDDWKEYYTTIGDLDTAWLIYQGENYEKWKSLAGEKLPELIEIYKKEFFSKVTEENLAMIDEVANNQTSMLDSQMSLIEATDSWNNSLGGVAGQIGNVIGAYKQMQKVAITSQKKQIKLDTVLSKTKEKFGEDSIEYQEALDAHIMATSDLKMEKQNAEIAGYSSLAGAMASAFEKGSAGAIAFTALQSALGIASSWTAIANAWALPYPANLAAVALVTSAVMPIIAQLGGSSGGGGGASAPSISSGMNFEANKDIINDTYTPLLNRLDRQIDLLESIDRNGSASQLGVEKAVLSFEKDYKVFVEDILSMSRTGMVKSAFVNPLESANWVNTALESAVGVDLFKTSETGKDIGLNFDILREGYNLLDTLLYYVENPNAYAGPLFQQAGLEAGYTFAEMQNYVNQQFIVALDEYQSIIADWTTSLIDSMSDLKDAKEDFMGYFDDITGTMFYQSQKLNEAYSQVDTLKGNATFESYLQSQIENIAALENFLTEDRINLLLSSKAEDVKAQKDLLEELGRVTNMTFENGAREALDYLESISLVADAMATSRNNITSFIESFMNDEEKLYKLAGDIGIEIATSYEDLISKFNTLSSDTLGLTDKELEYLEANKEYLDTLYDEQINKLTENIDSLSSVFDNITSTIDKLRDSTISSDVKLSNFYSTLASAKELLSKNQYGEFETTINKALGYSTALFDTKNFTSSKDMLFAQLSAANQLEGLNDNIATEKDLLQEISDNTADMLKALVSQSSSFTGTVADVYSSSRAGDKSYIEGLYEKVGQAVTTEGLNYWLNDLASGQSYSDVLNSFKTLFPSASFAVGTTNVPTDMLAQVHAREIITPATYADGLRNGELFMGNLSSITDGLNQVGNALLNKLDKLIGINDFYLRDIENNTRGSRFA